MRYDRIKMIKFKDDANNYGYTVNSGFTLQYYYKRKIIKSKQLYYNDTQWRVARGGVDFSMTEDKWDNYNEPYKIR